MGTMATLRASAAAAGGSEREIREAITFSKSHEQELERARQNSYTLLTDMRKQKKHCFLVLQHFKSQIKFLFPEIFSNNSTSMSTKFFLTYCIYPRCRLSPEDAMYCGSFIDMLHNMETPRFFTFQYLDVFIDAIVGALYCVTEDEAACIGVLLEGSLKFLSNLRYNESLFETCMTGKAGAQWSDAKNHICTSKKIMKTNFLSFEDYISLYNSWHETLMIAFIGCLRSSEYMHSRTALIFLIRIVRVFPTKSAMGEKLLLALQPLQRDTNQMHDLKTMAQGYNSQLLKARDDGIWKEVDITANNARVQMQKLCHEARKKKTTKHFEDLNKECHNVSRDIFDLKTCKPKINAYIHPFTNLINKTTSNSTGQVNVFNSKMNAGSSQPDNTLDSQYKPNKDILVKPFRKVIATDLSYEKFDSIESQQKIRFYLYPTRNNNRPGPGNRWERIEDNELTNRRIGYNLKRIRPSDGDTNFSDGGHENKEQKLLRHSNLQRD